MRGKLGEKVGRKILLLMITPLLVITAFISLPIADDNYDTPLGAVGDYNPNDIAVINNIIINNGLNWTPANPADGSYVPSNWTGVAWDGGATNQRIVGLYLTGTNLTGALNLTGLTALKTLLCGMNNVTSLNVSGLTALEMLACTNGSLTSLDVSGLTSLTTLLCSGNGLTSLNLTGLTKLTNIDCSINNLTSLNVSTLTVLEGLSCSGNNIASLDVSNLTKLTYLDCSFNDLGSLDVSKLVDLEFFDCSYNSLSSLDTSGLTALEELYCQNNKLTSLDVTGCSLNAFNCSKNYLTTITGHERNGLYVFQIFPQGDPNDLVDAGGLGIMTIVAIVIVVTMLIGLTAYFLFIRPKA
jgi:hypothetical protein